MDHNNDGDTQVDTATGSDSPPLLDKPTKIILVLCAAIALSCAYVLVLKHTAWRGYEAQFIDQPQPKASTVMVLDGVEYLIRPNTLKPVTGRMASAVPDDAAMVAKYARYRSVDTQMRHLTIRKERELRQNTESLYQLDPGKF